MNRRVYNCKFDVLTYALYVLMITLSPLVADAADCWWHIPCAREERGTRWFSADGTKYIDFTYYDAQVQYSNGTWSSDCSPTNPNGCRTDTPVSSFVGVIRDYYSGFVCMPNLQPFSECFIYEPGPGCSYLSYKICPRTIGVTNIQPEDDCRLYVGKPVSVASGFVLAKENDFQISGVQPFDFTRYYTTRNLNVKSFGVGWDHGFNTRVMSYGTNTYRVIKTDASITYYMDNDGNKVYDPELPRGEKGRLIKNANNTFVREFPDGSKEEFNTAGYLTAVIDRNGNRMTLTRDTGNKLTKVTDHAGREINIAYNTSYYIKQVPCLTEGQSHTHIAARGFRRLPIRTHLIGRMNIIVRQNSPESRTKEATM